MNWINLRTELLRSHEFAVAKKGAIETWLRVLAYCCEQENGGVIRGSLAWSNEVWLRSMTLSKHEVIDAHPLIQEEGDGYRIVGYPQSKQAEIEAKREAGRKGGCRSASRSDYRSVATEGEGEGEKKDNRKEKKNHLSGFDAFWDLFPLKVKKSKAQESWVKQRCSEVQDRIITAVQAQRNSNDWTKDNGQFIPHPTTYLNQRRWEDERPAPAKVIPIDPSAILAQQQQQAEEDREFAEFLARKAREA